MSPKNKNLWLYVEKRCAVLGTFLKKRCAVLGKTSIKKVLLHAIPLKKMRRFRENHPQNTNLVTQGPLKFSRKKDAPF